LGLNKGHDGLGVWKARDRILHTDLVGKHEVNIPLGSRKWEDDTKMDVENKKINGRMWSGFIWLRTGTNGCFF
jgi:hypothetical protein